MNSEYQTPPPIQTLRYSFLISTPTTPLPHPSKSAHAVFTNKYL